MTEPYRNFNVFQNSPGEAPLKMWTKKVQVEQEAMDQLVNVAKLPFVKPWVAVMPDVHAGMGSTIGSVIPMQGAVVPAAVGVDIGCGMLAAHMDVHTEYVRANASEIRQIIERTIPHGRTNEGGEGDRGAWGDVPEVVKNTWDDNFNDDYFDLVNQHPGAYSRNFIRQFGTLGTGNHFIEVSDDGAGGTWIVLHSGSRGLGNRIGSYFTKLAKKMCKRWFIELPDPNLAYLPQGTQEFSAYLGALNLAQRFAFYNRVLMINAIEEALGWIETDRVNCHHNYAERIILHGKQTFLVRKGAISAHHGEAGIIPGSMGAKSYIVEGLGNKESFFSASHGAGRTMSRTKARATFTVEDHAKATAGIECRKDADVLDETPGAYKDIDAVMESQKDLVRPVYELKQIVCVKG